VVSFGFVAFRDRGGCVSVDGDVALLEPSLPAMRPARSPICLQTGSTSVSEPSQIFQMDLADMLAGGDHGRQRRTGPGFRVLLP
jgi:hypothetical protein